MLNDGRHDNSSACALERAHNDGNITTDQAADFVWSDGKNAAPYGAGGDDATLKSVQNVEEITNIGVDL